MKITLRTVEIIFVQIITESSFLSSILVLLGKNVKNTEKHFGKKNLGMITSLRER